jgi:hypothetical protein
MASNLAALDTSFVHDRQQGLSKNSGNNNIEYNMTSYLWRSDPGSEHSTEYL